MVDELRQTRMLNQLHCVKLPCLDCFNLDQLIFNTSQFAMESTLVKAVRDCVKRIVYNSFRLEYSGYHFPLLMISYDYKRNDHTVLWKNTKDIFNEYDEITVSECGINRNNLLDLKSIAVSFGNFVRIFNRIRHVGNFKETLYLAGRLTELARMDNMLSRWNIRNSVSLIFFDGGNYENLIIQHLKKLGIVTVTMQHGQPVFHGMDTDRINQTIILNFYSDYVLVTGEYSKKQFMLGGVPKEAIGVVGSCRDIARYAESNSNSFSVFLDCPTYESSVKDNRKMIDIAEKIAKRKGFRYWIKLHPQDSEDKYYDLKLEYGEFTPQRKNIVETLEKSKFAILHASGVYLDIIGNGIKAYCMKTDFDFPLVEFDDDKFVTLEELELKLKNWENKNVNEKKEYMDEIVKYYLSPENSPQRHKKFIEDLIKIKAVE